MSLTGRRDELAHGLLNSMTQHIDVRGLVVVGRDLLAELLETSLTMVAARA